MMGTVTKTFQIINRRGFTMVEIICVIIIIGIVSSIALPAIDNFRSSDKCKAAASILVNYVRQAKYQAMQDSCVNRIRFAETDNDDSNVFYVETFEGDYMVNAASDTIHWASIADEEEVTIDAGIEVDLEKFGTNRTLYFKPDGYIYQINGGNEGIISELRIVFKYGNAAVAVDINALGVISSEAISIEEADEDRETNEQFFDDKYNKMNDNTTYTGTEVDY